MESNAESAETCHIKKQKLLSPNGNLYAKRVNFISKNGNPYLVWNNGKVSKASITSKNAGNLTVKYNGKQKALNFKAGETAYFKAES